ncbi:glycosyl transferase [Pedobacter yulinensis]|uniref:Glycosyl transferase n=1 Tax=Pedobacter yulinensis TaxID=2126353 RepID=A0A2T3HR31_9SPHI|nr:glycosyltransferase [Pedobacter yulinensis]PST84876.1 glycosyl transferase [Pedobacter yulinensis]
MSKNKITRWIDRNNDRVCLTVSRKYYRKLEAGAGSWYFLHPKFYVFYLLRLLLVCLNFFRFNRSLYRPYAEAWREPVNALKNRGRPSWSDRIQTTAATFCGLRYFIEPAFRPGFYEERIPLSELSFETEADVKVSIVIPVFNQVYFTLNCLRSLRLHLPAGIAAEIIVVDDCSTDDTAAQLQQIAGIRYIRNDENSGFIQSCRRGIAQSRGFYIALLNNDTLVQPGWLENLVGALENDETAGAAGSKLIYPYGLLQEAGCVLFNNGRSVNYGRHDDYRVSKYNFRRPVDYISGASLLFRRSDYEKLGGLDTSYTPAYYEDTDFCLAVQHVLGKKVIYQPDSCLVHFEGISSGKVSKKGNVKSFQEINKKRFLNKWSAELAGYPTSGKDVRLAAERHMPGRKLVFIDSYLPRFDRESGSYRVWQLLNMMQELQLKIVFVPGNGQPEAPYYKMLCDAGIEVLLRYRGKRHFYAQVKAACKAAAWVWACRPELNRRFSFVRNGRPELQWIYDTVDLHYVRMEREGVLHQNAKVLKQADKYKELELKLARAADVTVCITATEQQVLQQQGISNTTVIPNIHLVRHENGLPFQQRAGLLFIGSYDHTPNRDAAKWLVKEIMPLVWRSEPDVTLTLLGNNPTAEIRSLAEARVVVPGYIADISAYFQQSRVFVAPLRYGAGMKGKIGQSLEYALPIVSTSIGVEGMNLEAEQQVLVANDAQEFAERILELYRSEALWQRIHDNAIGAMRPFTPAVVKSQLRAILNPVSSPEHE